MTTPRPRRAWPATFAALLALASPAIAALPKVPEGFKIRLVASVPAVEYPCQIAARPDGALFIAEDPMDQVGPYEADNGRILLHREGKDPVVFAEGFRAIFGMAWHDGALYVMNMPRLTVLRDLDGDGKADKQEELFTDLGPKPRPGALNDHIVSGLQFGMDGWLYISVGDKGVPGVHGKDGRFAQLKGGGTMRCRPDGTGIEVISTGTRNHLEPNLDDRDNLFTYDNTDDGLGWWTRVTHHMDGGYYGYPYDYHNHKDRMLDRMAEYGGGSPCGAILYKEDAWPEKYRGLGFWAEWGKGHVAAIRFEPNGASFKVAEYIKFAEKDEGGEFRPIDLALSYDGRTLYIADWNMGGWGSKTEKVGRVFALTYDGKVEQKPRGKDSDPVEAQIKALDHPSFNERMRAQAALIAHGRRGEEQKAEVVHRTVGAPARGEPNVTSPVAKRHVVWIVDALAGGTPEGREILSNFLKNHAFWGKDPDVRAQAARALGLRADKAAVDALIAAVKDDEPTVRLQAIIALGRIKDAKAVPAIAPIVADSDPYLAFASRVALRRIGDWKAVEALAKSADPKVRAGLLAAMELQYATGAVEALKAEANDHSRPAAERAKALLSLSEAHHKPIPWDGSWWGTRPAAGSPPPKSVAWEGTPLVLEAVRLALADPDATIRLAAIAAVKDEKDREALPELRQRFTAETDEKVRREVAAALGAMDDRAALPLLISALRDAATPESVREAALLSIEAIGSDQAVKALVELLREPGTKADRQARVIAALGRSRARAAVATIANLTTSPDAKVRAAAAEALGKIGDTSAMPKVRALLKDDSLDVRKAAIASAAALRDREAIPALIALAEQGPTEYEATIALGAIPDIRALQVHLKGVAHRSQDVRKASAAAILAIRDQARPALERLAGRKELPPSALPELRRIYAAIRPITEWQVVGPFKKNERPPFQTNRPVDTSKPISSEGKTLAWKAVKAKDDGEVDVNKLYSGDNKSVFAYAVVESPTSRPARMAVGSDDTLHVWLNGREVFKHDGDRSFSAASDEFDVQLAKGKNRVVIRCGNSSGPWAFSVGVSSASSDYAFLQGPSSGGFNPEAFRAAALKGKGQAEHGKALFNDLKGVACIKCHAVAGQGGAVGPELGGVGVKYPREELIASVLFPSQKISSGYEPVILATADGRTLTGIIKSETPEAIEIEDAEAKRIKVAKEDLDGRKASDVSLMPNGLAEGLSPADFADLIAYLETLKDTSALHGPGASAPASKPTGR